MRKLFTVAAVLAAVAFPTASHAQFTLGGRLGLGFPIGDAYEVNGAGASMSDVFAVQVPFQLDAGFRVTPDLTLGGYASYGPTALGDDVSDLCDSFDLDCSAQVVRLGVQATYAFNHPGLFVPWVGAGIGYEWASYSLEGFGAKIEESVSGFEFLNLQVGGDFKVSRLFSFGPYAMFSITQYSEGTVEETGEPDVDTFDVADKTVHEWLTIGIRGKFDFGAQ